MGKPFRLAEAVARIPDGARIMIAGFMGVGTPPRLIEETVRQGKKDLTIIANDTAGPGVWIGKLIDAGLVRKVVTNHIGTSPETQRLMLAGEIEVELVPQGTLAERIRAGGYGLGGVLALTGIGTDVAEGKAYSRSGRPALLAGTTVIRLGSKRGWDSWHILLNCCM